REVGNVEVADRGVEATALLGDGATLGLDRRAGVVAQYRLRQELFGRRIEHQVGDETTLRNLAQPHVRDLARCLPGPHRLAELVERPGPRRTGGGAGLAQGPC